MLKTMIKSVSALLVLSFLATTGARLGVAGPLELVIGTGGTSSAAFIAGNGISIASVLYAKGIKIYNYGTKGDKDNIKRLTKKKRAINLALVSTKGIAKASEKEKKGMSGLLALGNEKGDAILLVVRNKAPKGVSKQDYNKAIAEIVRLLKDARAAKVIRAEWKALSVSSGDAAFKAAGLRRHKAAM
jgi:hypothetical protein